MWCFLSLLLLSNTFLEYKCVQSSLEQERFEFQSILPYLPRNDFSFTLELGVITFVHGPKGSGKTTTLQKIIGQDYKSHLYISLKNSREYHPLQQCWLQLTNRVENELVASRKIEEILQQLPSPPVFIIDDVHTLYTYQEHIFLKKLRHWSTSKLAHVVLISSQNPPESKQFTSLFGSLLFTRFYEFQHTSTILLLPYLRENLPQVPEYILLEMFTTIGFRFSDIFEIVNTTSIPVEALRQRLNDHIHNCKNFLTQIVESHHSCVDCMGKISLKTEQIWWLLSKVPMLHPYGAQHITTPWIILDKFYIQYNIKDSQRWQYDIAIRKMFDNFRDFSIISIDPKDARLCFQRPVFHTLAQTMAPADRILPLIKNDASQLSTPILVRNAILFILFTVFCSL